MLQSSYTTFRRFNTNNNKTKPIYYFKKNFNKLNKNINNKNLIKNLLFYKTYLYYAKIYLIGLGFKNFLVNNILYILVGDANYLLFKVPEFISVICKKNQIYMLSNDKISLFAFAASIKKVKTLNFYKGKGLLNFKNFKFTKLKVGKKQKFM